MDGNVGSIDQRWPTGLNPKMSDGFLFTCTLSPLSPSAVMSVHCSSMVACLVDASVAGGGKKENAE